MILVTGGRGRLGQALGAIGGARVAAIGREHLDITSPASVERALLEWTPAAVINTAVASGIDVAENEPSAACAINVTGPENLASLCSQARIPVIHISTDYVFGAETDQPWQEADPVSPINVYGRTKAEGEARVLTAHARACVARVAWLFGDGKDFIAKLLSAGGQEAVAVAGDQIGSPTPIHLAAERLLALADLMIAADPRVPPILHVAGSPPTSRADWVEFEFSVMARTGGRPPPLRRVSLRSFPAIARRPQFSALDCSLGSALFGSSLDWRDAVEERLYSRRTASPSEGHPT